MAVIQRNHVCAKREEREEKGSERVTHQAPFVGGGCSTGNGGGSRRKNEKKLESETRYRTRARGKEKKEKKMPGWK